jgi:hypothetical protein
LFGTPEYRYRVFVTNMKDAIDLLVWFYNQRPARRFLGAPATIGVKICGQHRRRLATRGNHHVSN